MENDVRVNLAQRITAMGGLILELGTGPGGGFMSFVLDNDINADIIISDLSPTVLKEWKRLFDKNLKPANIKYAALNTCDIPFKDESINVVSGYGAFGSIEGDKIKALKEIYRVLIHGGMYVAGDICIDKEYAKTIPIKAYNVLMARFPDILMDYYQESIDAGFTKIENNIGRTWNNKNDESVLASLCRELGIYLEFSTYTRYCYKE
jgi:ubiquinone/menaquinone biosynthesis C-methylase UbiE